MTKTPTRNAVTHFALVEKDPTCGGPFAILLCATVEYLDGALDSASDLAFPEDASITETPGDVTCPHCLAAMQSEDAENQYATSHA